MTTIYCTFGMLYVKVLKLATVTSSTTHSYQDTQVVASAALPHLLSPKAK
jgi:hypothetical protein